MPGENWYPQILLNFHHYCSFSAIFFFLSAISTRAWREGKMGSGYFFECFTRGPRCFVLFFFCCSFLIFANVCKLWQTLANFWPFFCFPPIFDREIIYINSASWTTLRRNFTSFFVTFVVFSHRFNISEIRMFPSCFLDLSVGRVLQNDKIVKEF